MTPEAALVVFVIDLNAGVRTSIQRWLRSTGIPLFETGSLFETQHGCSASESGGGA
jgi:hypothetical protein